MPGGRRLSTTCAIAVTWAIAALTLTSGWKNTLTTPTPGSDCDSICSMSFTVVVICRSK